MKQISVILAFLLTALVSCGDKGSGNDDSNDTVKPEAKVNQGKETSDKTHDGKDPSLNADAEEETPSAAKSSLTEGRPNWHFEEGVFTTTIREFYNNRLALVIESKDLTFEPIEFNEVKRLPSSLDSFKEYTYYSWYSGDDLRFWRNMETEECYLKYEKSHWVSIYENLIVEFHGKCPSADLK